MKVYKLRIPEFAGQRFLAVIAPSDTGILEEIEALEIGQTLTIEAVEMSEGEYKSLPEFDGW